jgi:hypothetical protein
MNERIPAWALYGLLLWALRPVVVPNGNSDGRSRPSRLQSGLDNEANTIAQRVQTFHARQTEGVTVDVEAPAFKARPGGNAGKRQPLFKPLVGPFAFLRVDCVLAAIARIELPYQLGDHRGLVLLHQIPQPMSIGMPLA